MIWKQYDYVSAPAGVGLSAMQARWTGHWEGRKGWDPDHTKEALWPTIADVVAKPGLLLEAGCGTGKWIHYFNKLGHRSVGVDYAPSALQVASASDPSLNTVRCDCRAMPFPDNTFDYLFANGTIEHDEAGPDAALRDFLRVLKPGGWLMSSVPCLNIERRVMYPWLVLRDWLKRRPLIRRLAGKKDAFEFYQYVFSPDQYEAALARNGFRVCSLRPYGTQRDVPLLPLLRPLLSGRNPFFCCHMVMGIARKP